MTTKRQFDRETVVAIAIFLALEHRTGDGSVTADNAIEKFLDLSVARQVTYKCAANFAIDAVLAFGL